jgi:hypothetical protein
LLSEDEAVSLAFSYAENVGQFGDRLVYHCVQPRLGAQTTTRLGRRPRDEAGWGRPNFSIRRLGKNQKPCYIIAMIRNEGARREARGDKENGGEKFLIRIFLPRWPSQRSAQPRGHPAMCHPRERGDPQYRPDRRLSTGPRSRSWMPAYPGMTGLAVTFLGNSQAGGESH